MVPVIHAVLGYFRDAFRTRRAIELEVLALRHQLSVYQRTVSRPRLHPPDRILWSMLSQHWDRWREAMVLVRPETVIRWQRRRFRDHWRRHGHGRRRSPGRPVVSAEVRSQIRSLSSANPLWGAPRIQAELQKIGIEAAKSTVEKYRVRNRRPPSPTWREFLRSHLKEIVAVDFFTVPTVRNQVLYVFLVLSVNRRRVVHCNVTANPTAAWTAQQIVEAFPWDRPPRFLQRDRDAIYAEVFRQRVRGMGFEEIVSAPRSPWQNAYVERLIGTLRRECLDHVIVLNEGHLRRVLKGYLDYYHRWRPHQGIGMDSPDGRAVQGPDDGPVIEVPEVFDLHHHYERKAS